MNAKFIKFAGIGATPGSLADNIRAYWKFDELTGTTIYDVTGNGFHGTAYGSPTLVTPGKLYYSVSCDGVDDYINCGTTVGDTGWVDFTIAGWVYLISSTNTYNGICGCWGDEPYYYLNLNESDYFRVSFSPYSGTSSTILSDAALSIGTWYHFAALFDRGGYMSLFINAVEQMSKVDISSYSATNFINNNTFNISNIGSNLAGYYGNIRIDGLGLWLRTLTSGEITQLYNSGYGLDYPFI